MITTDDALTLEELSSEVERLLREEGLLGAQHDSRVSAAPDARTIRYYATLGLLDRPEIVGRQARYGRRHVLQLLAIKALQGASMPLGEVQSRLYGKSDTELEAILRAATQAVAPPAPPEVNAWREVVLEPGLKLVAEEGWASALDLSELGRRVEAALAALRGGGSPPESSDRKNGGRRGR